MALFSKEDHHKYPPEIWVVKKHGSKWGVFTTESDNPINTFTTKIEAIRATTNGLLVDLYEKERRWYAGETVTGWKPYAGLTTTPQIVNS